MISGMQLLALTARKIYHLPTPLNLKRCLPILPKCSLQCNFRILRITLTSHSTHIRRARLSNCGVSVCKVHCSFLSKFRSYGKCERGIYPCGSYICKAHQPMQSRHMHAIDIRVLAISMQTMIMIVHVVCCVKSRSRPHPVIWCMQGTIKKIQGRAMHAGNEATCPVYMIVTICYAACL